MSQYLPVGQFSWCSLNRKKWLFDHLYEIDDADSYGYILEVDLEYPEPLHDLHNMYPLAPEHLVIDDDDLSKIQRQMLNKMKGKRVATTKLIACFKPRRKYVVHYRNLKFYLKHGMILTNIHRAIRFYQEPGLKSYIDYNTNKR